MASSSTYRLMLKPSPKTCTSCRARKVRCDGVYPTCGSCSKARKSVNCVYVDPVPTASKGDLLQKGAACVPCRRKKKKCDASRPFCSTCRIANKEDDCQYDDGVHRSIKAELYDRIKELEDRLRVYESQDRCASDSGSSSSRSSSERALGESILPTKDETSTTLFIEGSTNQSVTGTTLDIIPAYADLLTGDTFSLMEPIPREKGGMEVFHMSDLSPMREIFFSHRAQLGVCLSDEKLFAVSRGDLSNSVVHPVMVHVAQLWGSLVQEESSYFRMLTESMQLQSVLDYLNDSREILPPTTSLQAHGIISLYYFTKGDVFKGREYLLKSAHLLMRHDLHLVRSSHPTLSNDTITIPATEDEIGAILQVFYMDKAAHVQFRVPCLFHPELDSELYLLSEFHASMPIDIFAVCARTTAATYIQEVQQLICLWDDEQCCSIRSSRCYTKYWDLMRRIQVHLSRVKQRMLNTGLDVDHHFSRALKLAEIVDLTALTELHLLLASTNLESRQACFDTMAQMANFFANLVDEDYGRLDPILTLALRACIKVLRQEFNMSPSLISVEVIYEMRAVLQTTAIKLQRKLPFIDVSFDL
ncbi:uncharacterized protein BT62DRAFT_929321 [Guyanagaster necrorhizus]|uniref:Zn(2)-C6 fungal-type domain-containing protein n=1 Tax=Guyanagaster necrorhizus TaxID=856835 RepID=A0A9P7VZE7_9AGAR|nr:uncharacterized protein BT62DRAFT_929321 [Guyanagaster necrorhizus MCA 3950]KAG7449352.1 hypothetical protein BT62DRAFT_929321 [Guyanagaster necrorhizus MCA 3950]